MVTFAGNPVVFVNTVVRETPFERRVLEPLGEPPVSHITLQRESALPAEAVIQPS